MAQFRRSHRPTASFSPNYATPVAAAHNGTAKTQSSRRTSQRHRMIDPSQHHMLPTDHTDYTDGVITPSQFARRSRRLTQMTSHHRSSPQITRITRMGPSHHRNSPADHADDPSQYSVRFLADWDRSRHRNATGGQTSILALWYRPGRERAPTQSINSQARPCPLSNAMAL